MYLLYMFNGDHAVSTYTISSDIPIPSLILAHQHIVFCVALPGRPAMQYKRRTAMRDFCHVRPDPKGRFSQGKAWIKHGKKTYRMIRMI